MPDSREGRGVARPLRRAVLALAALPTALALMALVPPLPPSRTVAAQAAPDPTPSPTPSRSPKPSPTPSPTPTPSPSQTPSPTPSPTPVPTATASPTPTPSAAPPGELQISITDTSNQLITLPGFTFNIHVGSAGGQVVATISTDTSGTAVAGALNPATYCVEETSAPDGYQDTPTYSPAQCVTVASDSTQGRAPTLVTVIDPPAAPSPSPTDSGAVAATPTPTPSPTPSAAAQATVPQPPSTLAGTVAKVLVGLGALLLLAGAVMIVVAIRRRRRQPPPPQTPPNDYWYDSTIT
jgi:hypothetical protein